MSQRLRNLWEKWRTSYWLVPGVMLAGAVVLAMITLSLDENSDVKPGEIEWLYAGGPEGARTLLATVAGGVITTASLVFSITIVVLSQVSSQFGPRILRNFMKDTGNQVVLGTFVATFLYCLLILRSIRSQEAFVPHYSVSVAVAMACFSICLLIYFIHHVANSIQAPQLIAAIWRDIDDGIDRMFPKKMGSNPSDAKAEDEEPPAKQFPGEFGDSASVIRSPKSGYIQAIDQRALMRLACERDLRIKLLFRPGNFVIQGNPLALAWPLPDDDVTRAKFHEAFIIGNYHTPEQDVEFAFRQLVEIGVRALSPGINDPYTACNCIDWLGDALCRIIDADLQSTYRYDDEQVLRIIADVCTFEGIVDAAFNQIRQYGSDSPAVMIRLMETIARVAQRTDSPARLKPLQKHAQIIWRQGKKRLPDKEDLRDLADRYEVAMNQLRAQGDEG